MFNVMIANAILEVLAEGVKLEEVFTAYDITLGVRSITDDNVRHSDVQNIVTKEYTSMQMNNYMREYCALDINGKPKAFVYFPAGKSANDHPLVSGSSVSSDGDGSTDNGSDSTAVDLDDDEYQLTSEGRINIPKQILSQVTVNAGSYDILISGSLKCVAPNKDGRVRVSLRNMGIMDSKIKMVVSATNNTINIETV